MIIPGFLSNQIFDIPENAANVEDGSASLRSAVVPDGCEHDASMMDDVESIFSFGKYPLIHGVFQSEHGILQSGHEPI